MICANKMACPDGQASDRVRLGKLDEKATSDLATSKAPRTVGKSHDRLELEARIRTCASCEGLLPSDLKQSELVTVVVRRSPGRKVTALRPRRICSTRRKTSTSSIGGEL